MSDDYTFKVCCTFTMQHTFAKGEVERDGEGDAEGVEPTDTALKAIEVELGTYLSEKYSIGEVDVSTDSDLIMHAPGDPDST
jgi:hypothetical protein